MGVSVRHRWAVLALAAGLGSMLWVILAGDEPPPASLLVAAAAAPMAVLLAVVGRTGGWLPGRAIVGGGVIGPVVALAGHAVVFAFAAAFILGFRESGRALLDSLRIDPRLTEILSSPWVLLLLVDLVVVAPLTEETGKALGAGLARPATRRDAFVSGVAAGAGFAIVENILYASVAATFGGPWPAVVVARAMGAAVHPLASGLVVMGWWDAHHGGGGPSMARGFFAGAGVHAIWNASMVAVVVAQTGIWVSGAPYLIGTASLAFTGVLGVVAAAVLWWVAGQVLEPHAPTIEIRASEARAVAGWIVLTAGLLVPVAILILAFPSFYTG
jgi:RsiW-degrading membrane proteinase PrsW (M82 family)